MERQRYRPGQGLEARGCGRPEAGAWTRASMGRSSCPTLSVPRGQRSEPSTWPPEQLHSWLVSGFVIYYTKLKETTQALIVGTQTTRVAQKQVSRSWPQTGQEEHGRDLPAIDVPEMTNPPDYKPLGWSSRFPKPKTQEPNTSTGPS